MKLVTTSEQALFWQRSRT